MPDVPAATPATKPDASTVATEPLLLLQLPPVNVLPSDVVAPAQMPSAPVMAGGAALTVTSAVAMSPDTLYVMVAVPAAMPVTMPVADTVAFAALLLLHVPPVVLSLKEVVEPTHTASVPNIPGVLEAALTVTFFVATAVPQLLVIV